MSPRKAGQQELTREMIMDAARDLFAKKGYQSVSMRQIAKKLQYSHGAIYYHFKNKAELFYALVEDHFDLLNKELNRIVQLEVDNKEKLRQIFIGYIRFGLTHQNHYEIMFLIKDEEIKDYINQGPIQTYENFAQHVNLLCGKQLTPHELWSVFLSLHGFVTHYCRHVMSFTEIEEFAAAHAEFLIKALN